MGWLSIFLGSSATTALCATNMKIVIDQRAKGELRSRRGQHRLCHQRDGVFAILLPPERPSGELAGVRGIVERPDSGATAQNWQDRGIILL